jgi:hypothetical protein
VNDTPQAPDIDRAGIARRNRRRELESREYNLMLVTVGIVAYSAFSNLMGLFGWLGTGRFADAAISAVFTGLYGFAAYRVWARSDVRWWVVGIPAGLAVLLTALIIAHGFGVPVLPLALNIVLLILVPVRIRTRAALLATAPPPQESIAEAAQD